MKGYFEKCYDHDKEYDAVGRRGEVVIDFGNINGKLSKANSTLSRKHIAGMSASVTAHKKYLKRNFQEFRCYEALVELGETLKTTAFDLGPQYELMKSEDSYYKAKLLQLETILEAAAE